MYNVKVIVCLHGNGGTHFIGLLMREAANESIASVGSSLSMYAIGENLIATNLGSVFR